MAQCESGPPEIRQEVEGSITIKQHFLYIAQRALDLENVNKKN